MTEKPLVSQNSIRLKLSIDFTDILAYDLQLLINKGIFDIVKPQWIHDSVEKGSRVPLSKRFDCVFVFYSRRFDRFHRYFYHATAERLYSADYIAEGEEDEDIKTEDGGPSEVNNYEVPRAVQNDEAVVKSEDSVDPALEAWLREMKEDDKSPNDRGGANDDSDTATDDDSDNEDVREAPEAQFDDGWSLVKSVEGVPSVCCTRAS